jgi:hypothetical protein
MAPVSQLQNRIRDTIVMFYSVVLKEKKIISIFIKWKYRARWIELARQ